MSRPSKVPYHLSQQYAYALLGPICRELAELESRSQGYLDHLNLSPEDREVIETARDRLRAALGEVAALRQAAPLPDGSRGRRPEA
ncbi:MAG TPA: hypothetical protein VKU87_03350 [Thermomicrobiaceae bacterium]|nr:hypothetical protein [Thermomicrobiaceae bacterium]